MNCNGWSNVSINIEFVNASRLNPYPGAARATSASSPAPGERRALSDENQAIPPVQNRRSGAGLRLLLISSAWQASRSPDRRLRCPPGSRHADGVLPSAACPLDVYLLMDLTGSMGGELATLQANSALITSTLLAANPNTRFGIGWFQDYPMIHMVYADDRPYVARARPDHRHAALHGCAEQPGAWQWLGSSGKPAASAVQHGDWRRRGIYIPAGQQANFRSEAAKVIVLVTDAPFHDGDYAIPSAVPPNSAQTAAALQALPRAQVLGIFSNPDDPEYIIDLVSIVQATRQPGAGRRGGLRRRRIPPTYWKASRWCARSAHRRGPAWQMRSSPWWRR